MASMKGIFEDIKGAIKSLNRRRPDNTMAKKNPKGQTTIYKTLHRNYRQKNPVISHERGKDGKW